MYAQQPVLTSSGPMAEEETSSGLVAEAEESGEVLAADKGASSGTTSDGSWRVLRAPVDSDWAEVPLDQGSQPSSPLAHTGDSAGPGEPAFFLSFP